ncbi:SGNH/GDSL hydrolase family protein [Lentisphaera profundi]|uniref:SGNH/GDSL hydrolase family protein n=1 Tax=Lentisphaera profundi TaxID=1658616 RepID=A0ABY7VUX1_9BACT|nr:SGNH/GDSL hydrolase family protein [Lentisphaera profundi]WDE96549.1 SGNH/GDSL hydrolase family protein [Lentisphaera profundi]
MKNNIIKLLLTLSLTCSALFAVEPGSAEEKAKGKKWIPTPIEGKANALIIGDSISIGYTLQVRDLLEGKVNVYRPILEGTDQPWNCGHTSSINGGLDRMLKGPKWDVIHFNTGLHDLKRINRKKGARSDDPSVPVVISLEQYREGLEKIVIRLKATGAKVIFATTTPYVEGVYPCRIPEDAVKYNQVAIEVMKKHDVAINDLYSASLPKLKEWQQNKNVHFNEVGKQKLAELVAESIKNNL